MTPNGPAIVLDNSDSTVVVTGTWTVSTVDPGYLGPNYQAHASSTGTDSFIWPLVIGTSGSYRVYARWTADTNRSTAATFTVGSNAAVHQNQTTNGSKWVLLGTYTLASGTTNVKLTTDSSGAVIADAVKAVLASQDGVTGYYIYPDQIDTPRIIIRPSDNQMVWRWDQADPFGSVTPNQNPASLGSFVYNPRFQGQLFDSEDNLVYNYFRNYDPTLGRYVQSDPTGIEASLDTFSYSFSDPNYLRDPDGQGPIGGAIGTWGGRIIGGVAGEFIDPAGGGIPGAAIGGAILGRAGSAAGDALSDWMFAAPGNQADSQIQEDYGRAVSEAKLNCRTPPEKCEWLAANAGYYSAARVKATAKAWGCKGSRYSEGGSVR